MDVSFYFFLSLKLNNNVKKWKKIKNKKKDGAARTGSSLFGELRNAVFAKVSSHAVRSVSKNIFKHLHSLDLSFHLSRQTGGLSRAIDRGNK